jgi:Carboxypeptidase regulatory-like domain
MFYRRCIILLFLSGAFVLAPTALAQIGTHLRDYDAAHTPVVGGKPTPLEGTVRGTDGRLLQGAEVRIEGKGKSSAPITTITGSNGQYLFAKLPVGLYKMSIVADGAVKFSANIKMRGEKARIDFDLRPSAGKKTRNYAWVPGRSGSNLAGRWVEVGDTVRVKRPNVGFLPGEVQPSER